jgi:hypothetical protein
MNHSHVPNGDSLAASHLLPEDRHIFHGLHGLGNNQTYHGDGSKRPGKRPGFLYRFNIDHLWNILIYLYYICILTIYLLGYKSIYVIIIHYMSIFSINLTVFNCWGSQFRLIPGNKMKLHEIPQVLRSLLIKRFQHWALVSIKSGSTRYQFSQVDDQ